MTKDDFEKKYSSILEKMIYGRRNIPDVKIEGDVYGICGYQNQSASEEYVDRIETLMLIKKGQ